MSLLRGRRSTASETINVRDVRIKSLSFLLRNCDTIMAVKPSWLFNVAQTWVWVPDETSWRHGTGSPRPRVAYIQPTLGLLQPVPSRLALDTAHYHPPSYPSIYYLAATIHPLCSVRSARPRSLARLAAVQLIPRAICYSPDRHGNRRGEDQRRNWSVASSKILAPSAEVEGERGRDAKKVP